jgi:tripartite motif-containing protein 37
MLKEVQEKPPPSVSNSSVSSEFESEIIPDYESTDFYLRNFSKIRDSSEVIYSDVLNTNGLSWRLKIYPNGNGVARGNFISVFLEMIKGLNES